jgi:hypothetical protein
MISTSTIHQSMIAVTAAAMILAIPANAQNAALPDPTSSDFCVAVQHILADTEIAATNEIFPNMPDYRHSKPSPNPLMIYQVVTYDDVGPIVVSCKVKTADHIRAEYGEDAAGEQRYCPEITRMVQAQAVAELQQWNPDAAAAAQAFVIDESEPFMMGSSYLADFQSSYVGEDGAIHFQSPGLQTNWEDWLIWVMPNRLRGQTYCHLPTVAYMKRVAAGTTEPGATITTVDDAPTQPPTN